jgi:hypothetical protein
MTRLARRSSLLVAFYLLTSAATTHAECAWVLWLSETRPVTGEHWTVLGAYPGTEAAHRECEKEVVMWTNQASGQEGARAQNQDSAQGWLN